MNTPAPPSEPTNPGVCRRRSLPDSTARAERHLLDDSVLSTGDAMCTSLYLPDGGADGAADDDDVAATLPML